MLHNAMLIIVRWGKMFSRGFQTSNGVRQGGILSPIFFNIYYDGMSAELNRCNVGCVVDQKIINHFLYADDVTLIAPTAGGMNVLLGVCHDYGIAYDIIFNANKSSCLVFGQQNFDQTSIKMNDNCIPIHESHKYLGHVINCNAKDDDDIKNQVRCLYARGNNIVRNFKHCSVLVKKRLFQAYCCSFYCCSLWWKHTSSSLHKLKMAFNRVYRNLMNLARDSSIRTNLVNDHLPSFDSIIRNAVYSLYSRLESSSNTIVKSVLRGQICTDFLRIVRNLFTS